MSDVLVKMLRGRCNCNMPSTPCGSEDECRFDFRVADRIEELEARLAKAEVIVRIIASDKWDERLGEAVDLSCEYLAELMGDEDDE